MSKAISFGFGKPKAGAPAKGAGPRLPQPKKTQTAPLRAQDSDNEEDDEPQHESVTGFSSTGAILSKPVQQTEVKIIQNSGNGDWRTRGRKNLLPEEVQAAQNGEVVMVERDEVSKASGLQYSEQKEVDEGTENAPVPGSADTANGHPAKEMTEDEIAMAALLGDRPKSNAIIAAQANARLQGQDETTDFREDVASRPESSTLEDYAAMPVEEFGLAMLRGMGQKRKAAGQTINLESEKDDNPRKIRKQEGFLGIGAKAAPGSDVELGAWGKADMRKNNKGQGFFTPLMRENKETGERITEEEFQKRIRDSKNQKPEQDWRDRRDRNLERSGRDRDSKRDGDRKAITNGDGYDSSRHSSSSRRYRDEEDEDRHKSRRHNDDRDSDGVRSKRDRSRSRDRRRRNEDDYDSKHRDKHRSRHRDDDHHASSSSQRSRHRDRERDRDRDWHRDDDRKRRDDR